MLGMEDGGVLCSIRGRSYRVIHCRDVNFLDAKSNTITRRLQVSGRPFTAYLDDRRAGSRTASSAPGVPAPELHSARRVPHEPAPTARRQFPVHLKQN